jgi:hypothetical protein
VIVSLHIADVRRRAALSYLRTKLHPDAGRGLRYVQPVVTAPLSGHLLPRPALGRVGLIAAWADDSALDEFLAHDPLAAFLAHGWRVRLSPTRVVGSWPALPGLPVAEEPMDEAEPAAVLTLGRLRPSQTLRFLRATAAAEELVVREPAVLAATGLAHPPALVATFSLWRSTGAMRAYARGEREPGHRAAVRAHAEQPFHSQSAFVRFRPYRSEGAWGGRDPLASVEPEAH